MLDPKTKKWLIEAVFAQVIATIGIPPSYIDRGDPTDWDWERTDFIEDGLWHDLDLSGIVPAEAKAVYFNIDLDNFLSNKAFDMRKKGNVNEINIHRIKTYTLLGRLPSTFIVACDENRIVQYREQTGGDFGPVFMVVKGWYI